MGEGSRGPDAVTLTVFLAAVTLGGGNFIAVVFSNRELAPFWGAGLRFAVAGALFVAIALAQGLHWPRGRQLTNTVLYGLLGFAVSYALMYWALARVPAGMATVVLAVVPLMTLLLAAAQRLERLHWRGAVGALLALVGILWMVLGPEAEVVPLAPLLVMLGASVTIGQSIILSKRVATNHPAVTNAVGMLAGATVLLVLSVATGESWALPRQRQSLWAVVYLVTLGSVGLFVLVLLVVRRWTASASSYMFVLFPVVTLGLGAWLADEAVTMQAVSGALLVMAGVWFGALAPAARRLAGPKPERTPSPAIDAS